MDAIPSLCASTASCGAAASGFAFGRPSSTPRGNETEESHGAEVDPSTSLEPRVPPPTPASRIFKAASFRRPQSATLPRVSSWSVFGRSSFEEPKETTPQKPTGEEIVIEGASDTPVLSEEPEGQESERLPWGRRVSTIAQSRDGSTVSTTTRPKSPSVFSNGSSVPILGYRQIITPRNKLVKRSTSQRVLHSGSTGGSPFSALQTPTFRRPATSHQRSEQLRLQSIQREFGISGREWEISEEGSVGVHTPTTPPRGHTEQNCTWQPFFVTKTVSVASEARKRSASTAKIPIITSISSIARQVDTVRYVEAPLGQRATLLKPTDLDKNPTFETPRRRPKIASTLPLTHFSAEKNQSGIEKDSRLRAQPSSKSRHSILFGSVMSTPSPPWNARGGSLRRKKGRESADTGRRVVSAPLATVEKTLHDTDSNDLPIDTKAAGIDSHRKGSSPIKKKASRASSSHLPPLNRMSAFEIDLLGETSSGPPSPTAEQLMSTSPLSTLENSVTTQGSLRIKPHRPSRVPSDRESTAFSSDNEHNRVFSADGDDTDYRSETQFDSIRTDATTSSRAGFKGQGIETMFDDTRDSDSLKQNLAALAEQLERSSLSDITPQPTITGEVDNVGTPDSFRRSERDQTVTPQRGNGSSASIIPSSPPSMSTPTRRKEIYPQEIEFGDDWSADEGDNESDGGGTPRLPSQHANNRIDLRRRIHKGDAIERPISNIFDWSERNPMDRDNHSGSSPRPRTAYVKQAFDRGSRSASRRGHGSYHVRSQSVPLPPENSNHRFNNASKLDAWILGGKGVSEDWGDDFEFDEDSEGDLPNRLDHLGGDRGPEGVIVPPSIIEKQASVHGQFGQVKELTLLVEELRRLRHSAFVHGILGGQASELWKEAEGIIDLATLDEEEGDPFAPQSPASTNFDFEAFDDESPPLPRRRRSSASPQIDSLTESPVPSRLSPAGSRFETPPGRPRKESIAKAKNVLENIHQHRSSLDPLPDTLSSPRKLPFDTTSLRDLVTRAGVVTRALKEIIRRIENSDSIPQTPERSSEPPPDPPFSQIFNHPVPSSPSSSKKSPRAARRKSSSSFLNNQKSTNDNDFNGHMKIMTVA